MADSRNPASQSVATPPLTNECGRFSFENPYAEFNCCCATLETKQHAQQVGVSSLFLFMCLVLLSLYRYDPLSIFYITVGTAVYAFLVRSLFSRTPDKLSVIAYLFFEAIQIGFYVALVLYILMQLMVGPPMALECPPTKGDTASGNSVEDDKECSPMDPEQVRSSYAQLLSVVILLAVLKIYFAKVFARYYWYLVWSCKADSSNAEFRAQYINGRGVRIDMGDLFAPPPLQLWTNSANQDPAYTYAINPAEGLPSPPSYSQAVRVEEKQPVPSSPAGGTHPPLHRPADSGSPPPSNTTLNRPELGHSKE